MIRAEWLWPCLAWRLLNIFHFSSQWILGILFFSLFSFPGFLGLPSTSNGKHQTTRRFWEVLQLSSHWADLWHSWWGQGKLIYIVAFCCAEKKNRWNSTLMGVLFDSSECWWSWHVNLWAFHPSASLLFPSLSYDITFHSLPPYGCLRCVSRKIDRSGTIDNVPLACVALPCVSCGCGNSVRWHVDRLGVSVFRDGWRNYGWTKVLPFFTIDSWVELLAEALIPKHKFDGDLWIWWFVDIGKYAKYKSHPFKSISWKLSCSCCWKDFWKLWLWWLLVRAIRASGWCSCTAYEKWQRRGLLTNWIKKICWRSSRKKETWKQKTRGTKKRWIGMRYDRNARWNLNGWPCFPLKRSWRCSSWFWKCHRPSRSPHLCSPGNTDFSQQKPSCNLMFRWIFGHFSM